MTGLTHDERLAVLNAMSKQLDPMLKDAKNEARQELMEGYDRDGCDRRAIKVNGEKVGEVGMSYTTPKPCIVPGREAEAVEFLRPLGLTEEAPKKGWEKRFAQAGEFVIHSETGEFCDWARWEGRMPKTAVVRGCEPADVMPAIQRKLGPGGIAALLEGGAQ